MMGELVAEMIKGLPTKELPNKAFKEVPRKALAFWRNGSYLLVYEVNDNDYVCVRNGFLCEYDVAEYINRKWRRPIPIEYKVPRPQSQ